MTVMFCLGKMKDFQGSFLLGSEWAANSHGALVEGGELQTSASLREGEAAAPELGGVGELGGTWGG